ncbi:MAG: metallophosphoesterase [Nocardioidaceae bacterium]
MPFRSRVLGATAVAGIGGLAYAYAESRWFALRTATIPVLPAGKPDLRVLHLSDLHLTPWQRRKQAWVRDLAALEPDLVVNTGDNFGHAEALPSIIEAYDGLLDVPGVFVFGSNDYFAPTPRNPVQYLLPDRGHRHVRSPTLPWPDLRDELEQRGWAPLWNRTETLEVAGVRLAFAGVDDPHLKYDDLAAVAGPADPDADVRIGVAHAPYLRVLDQFADDGYDLTIAGHTHGGQLCLPFAGAIVTNCDLDRRRAKGLHRHPADSRPGDPGGNYLHVSAGLGTSPYAQVRFCCRPEATLLTFTAMTN